MEDETYLGDGLYASHDGFQFWLRAPREDGDHRVALEDGTLSALLAFARRIYAAREKATQGFGAHEG